MLLIGSHVSFNPEQLLSSVKEAISYNANTFMFYTGAPTNTIRKEINPELLKQAQELMNKNGIDISNVICHAPYIINLANNKDPDKWQFSINFLRQEIERCQELGIKTIVLHPGSAVAISKEEGIKNIINALDKILSFSQGVTIALETMAGKGSECGSNIQEITQIINGVSDNQYLGVCLDTCHLNDAGYDMSKFDEFLNEFKKYISVDKIKCVHINDSKNVQSSHKDRHANIGFGTIGFDNILKIVHHPTLIKIPKILETPYIGENDEDKNRIYPPYKFEINMLKNQQFDADILNKIREYYK